MGTQSAFIPEKKNIYMRIRKGSVFHGRDSGHSIPPKYETIISESTSEKGFGNSSIRFRNVVVEDSPGPGQYNSTISLGTAEVVSKKGYGNGFASQSSRFSKDINGRIANWAAEPGPSQYTIADELNVNNTTASSFAPIYKDELSKKDFDEGFPGPGQYLNGDLEDMNNNNNNSASFLSQTKRIFDSLKSDYPSPGQYEVISPKETKSYHSAFRSNSIRTILVDKDTEKMPGPGNYFLPTSDEKINVTKSSGVLPPEKSRRTQLYQAKIKPKPLKEFPGPGDFENTSTNIANNDSGGATAAFRSNTVRSCPFLLFETVGPGLYEISSSAKKPSFHLNKQKFWV